jgi:hypothetical protein
MIMAHGARTYAETRNCNHCGSPYRRRRDAAKQNRGLYCSIKCSNAGRFGPMTADIAVLKTMYCEQDMTLTQMALVLNTTWKRIRGELVRAGVQIRKPERRRNPARRSMVRYRRLMNAQKGEVVHHLNCIETDDRLENLVAVSRPRHSQLHKQLEQISAKLFTVGLISFDPRNGYAITRRLSELM